MARRRGRSHRCRPSAPTPVGYYQLACAALASWSGWAKRLGEVGFRRGGQLRWEANPPEGRQLAGQVQRARSRGSPIVPVSEQQLRRLLPAATPGPGRRRLPRPRDGQVEPDLVVAAGRAATRAAGGHLLLGEPALGRLVAEEIATGKEAWLLGPFRPGRFAERATRVVLDVEGLFR